VVHHVRSLPLRRLQEKADAASATHLLIPSFRIPSFPQKMSDGIASPAVRAPDFPDTLDWLHTAGRRLTLGDFRGKLLLLDFWTYG
jgi:hypothetical protein